MTTKEKETAVATLSFTANQTDLQVLGHLARITNKMFPNIKIEATSGDMLTCSATDGSISMVAKVRCINGAGACCIEGKKFYELLSKSVGKVNFDDGIIKFGKNKFKLPTCDTNNFMVINEVEGDLTSIETKQFVTQLKKTTFAANGMGILGGISLNAVELASTDGNMLAVNKFNSGISEQIIIPKTLCDELIKCFDNTSELELVTNGVKIMIKSDDMTLISTLLDGQYPKYAQLIPSETKSTINLDKQEILNALDLLSVVKNISTNICVLEFADNNLKISANNADNGEGSIDIDVDYTDDALKIAFNIEYLKSILKNTCDDVFEIGLTAPLSPALIRNGDDVTLIMPVQIRG